MAARARARVPDRVHVFGYGSLVATATRLATLHGHRRVWGVAMDNRHAIPGYKVYEAPDGTRPPVSVAFLDLEPDDDASVEGGLLEVDAAALEDLERRERQYRRVEVTEAIDPAPGGRVWTFAGRDEGRERVRRGRAGAERVVIQRAYADLVEAAFAALGAGARERYRASTEPPPFPVVELARVDLPPA